MLSIFLSWYAISFTTTNGSQTYAANFYPGQTVTLSSTSGTSSTTYSTTYTEVGLNNTGSLYSLIQALLVVGALLGVIGGGLLIAAGTRLPSVATLGMFLLIMGAGVAIFCPLATLIHQPSALAADSYVPGSSNSNNPGPTTSFAGSELSSSGSGSWGPGLGWFLPIVAFILLVVGVGVAYSSPEEGPVRVTRPSMSLSDSGSRASQSQGVAERFCPSCGMGCSRYDTYCQKCGRALPPPP